MRTRNHDWFDLASNRVIYSFQVYHGGKWRHVSDGHSPMLFMKPHMRDACRDSYRSRKPEPSDVVGPRDAYDTLNDEVLLLREQLKNAQAEADFLRAAKHGVATCSIGVADTIAKAAAHNHGTHLPYVREAGLDFEPHLWVVEAVRAGFAMGVRIATAEKAHG